MGLNRAMKDLDQWLTEYSQNHQHPGNKIIHYFCVPLITYSTLGLFDVLSQEPFLNLPFSLAYAVIALCGFFYLRLNLNLGIVLVLISLIMVFTFRFYPGPYIQLYSQTGIFLISWLLQFIGHRYEAAKPSFLEDLTFLLVGPLWMTDRAFKSSLR